MTQAQAQAQAQRMAPVADGMLAPLAGDLGNATITGTTYAPTTWQDGEGGGTPITAAALNHLEQGLAAVSALVPIAQTTCGPIILRKVGHAVYVSISPTATMGKDIRQAQDSGDSSIIGGLPSGYVPTETVSTPLLDSDRYHKQVGVLRINTLGQVAVYGATRDISAGEHLICCNAAYLII